MVRLSLPGGARKGADVECKGVIVRTEDEPRSGGFKIAIFFNAIQNIQRKKISDYLKRFLNPAPALQSA
jgi:hypothetical protein